jgi:hypothetical protein
MGCRRRAAAIAHYENSILVLPGFLQGSGQPINFIY